MRYSREEMDSVKGGMRLAFDRVHTRGTWSKKSWRWSTMKNLFCLRSTWNENTFSMQCVIKCFFYYYYWFVNLFNFGKSLCASHLTTSALVCWLCAWRFQCLRFSHSIYGVLYIPFYMWDTWKLCRPNGNNVRSPEKAVHWRRQDFCFW